MFIFMSYVRLGTVLGRVLRRDERGATAVEYALFIALVAAVIFGAVLALGQLVLGLFTAPIDAGF